METEPKKRKLDELGRIALPIEYRSQLNWQTGDTITCRLDAQNETIVLYKEQ